METHRSAGQQLIRRNPWTTRPFVAVAVVAGALTLFTVLQANRPEAARLHDWPWNIRLLGEGPMTALFAASVGWLLLREQNARAVEPLMRYVSRWVATSERLAEAAKYRQVLIKFGGRGSAVINAVRWQIQGTEANAPVGAATMPDLRALLSGLGLTDARDYSIANYSAGTSLDPGEERLYFECTEDALARFHVFDAVFTFDSLAGDRFERVVSMLPHPGASAATTGTT